MTNEQHNRMQSLLQQQETRAKALRAVKVKTDIRAEMPFFDVKYRFAEKKEQEKIEAVLAKLPIRIPGKIDTAALAKAKTVDSPTNRGHAWLCFMAGKEEYMKLFVGGSVTDILNDLETWTAVSPMLLLIYGDYRHFVFLDDNGIFTESELTPDNK